MKKCNLKPADLPAVLAAIEETAGYAFQHRELLCQALCHSSFAAEQTPSPEHNQRLEFLGDAVLQLVLSERLFHRFPDANEGELTQGRAFLAREKSTAEYCRKLGLQPAMMLGNGEIKTGGRDRLSILGDAFEALLGAVFLDGGLDSARQVCQAVLPDDFDLQTLLKGNNNHKGVLQEYCQVHLRCRPNYIVVGQTGPVHNPVHEVKVEVKGQELARASSSNRQDAAQKAAGAALECLKAQAAASEIAPAPEVAGIGGPDASEIAPAHEAAGVGEPAAEGDHHDEVTLL